MNRFGFSSRAWFASVLLALAVAVLPACNPQPVVVNALQSISLAPGQTLALDTPLNFILSGTGTCNAVSIDWGDGRTDPNYGSPGNPIDLSGSDPGAVASRTLTHTFTGWGGGKTVTVDGTVQGFVQCFGRVNLRFDVPPLQQTIGWNTATPPGTVPGGQGAVCRTSSPGLPDMLPRMLVHASAALVGN